MWREYHGQEGVTVQRWMFFWTSVDMILQRMSGRKVTASPWTGRITPHERLLERMRFACPDYPALTRMSTRDLSGMLIDLINKSGSEGRRIDVRFHGVDDEGYFLDVCTVSFVELLPR